MKVAVLSNVNMNGTIRILKRNIDVFSSDGYGNEIGTMLNSESLFNQFAPNIVFLIEDLDELLGHTYDVEDAKKIITKWYSELNLAIDRNTIYYVSDAFLHAPEVEVFVDKTIKILIEEFWDNQLMMLVSRYENVRVFPYRSEIVRVGTENAFSTKMWYLGKMVHSVSMQQSLAKLLEEYVKVNSYFPKKVLLLDLDNTLWGGLAGENDISPIELSEDHSGLAYKNAQRVILAMKEQGVILGIVSKNNEEDVAVIFDNNPHMVLKKDDFAIMKINWIDKPTNIREISNELNVGLDSIVFWDDNPEERHAVRQLLPEVIVPEYPNAVEELPDVLVGIWKQYFNKPILTNEDTKKTEQYIANSRRTELEKRSASFKDYLQSLHIVLSEQSADSNFDRILQLLNKTNQFNTTTIRHERTELMELMQDKSKRVFAYQVKDAFGDMGIVAVAILDLKQEYAVIEELVMSCRAMGKNIENAIIEDIEDQVKGIGYLKLRGRYRATAKNQPIQNLFLRLGYVQIETDNDSLLYELDIEQRPIREYELVKERNNKC